MDSDVYEAIEALYIHQGLSLPSTTGPYSQAELSLMVEKIRASALKGSMKNTYEYVQAVLGLQPKSQGRALASAGALIPPWRPTLILRHHRLLWKGTLELRRNQPQAASCSELGNVAGDSFSGYSELSVGNTYTLENGFGTTTSSTNVPMVPPSLMTDLDFNMPYRAFVAAGEDHWSFQLGRDRLSWGAGQTGNLMVSDSFKYHTMARVTTFSDWFKYTFV
ncbi:MAG: hypothetical protein PWP59_268, partial [Sphaerochaeta sp.]|nr:hypothetical protein [Sphaerochaeta sp.]